MEEINVKWGWSDGPMVLNGKLTVPGGPTNLDLSRAKAFCFCSRCSGCCLDIFSLIYHLAGPCSPICRAPHSLVRGSGFDTWSGNILSILLSLFSRRVVVSYWRKYVHKVLVNRLGGLSLPRKSVVRLTDHPDMTLDVYRKKTIQQLSSIGRAA